MNANSPKGIYQNKYDNCFGKKVRAILITVLCKIAPVADKVIFLVTTLGPSRLKKKYVENNRYAKMIVSAISFLAHRNKKK